MKLIPNSIKSFLAEQFHLVILGILIGGLSLIWLIPILSNISFGSSGCSVDARPAPPTLLSVTQDPDTLVVTAVARDESDDEQWFSLQRTLINRNNQVVGVGTDIPDPDSDSLPINREIGRTVTIIDRGIGEDRLPTPGETYVYTVRALNCFAESPRSNDLSIVALEPR